MYIIDKKIAQKRIELKIRSIHRNVDIEFMCLSNEGKPINYNDFVFSNSNCRGDGEKIIPFDKNTYGSVDRWRRATIPTSEDGALWSNTEVDEPIEDDEYYEMLELSANQIDMNDLYTEEQFNTSAISSDMTFDEFYKLVSETDSVLAARIDKWFINHSKNMVFDANTRKATLFLSKLREEIKEVVIRCSSYDIYHFFNGGDNIPHDLYDNRNKYSAKINLELSIGDDNNKLLHNECIIVNQFEKTKGYEPIVIELASIKRGENGTFIFETKQNPILTKSAKLFFHYFSNKSW